MHLVCFVPSSTAVVTFSFYIPVLCFALKCKLIRMKSRLFFKAALLHSVIVWLLIQASDIVNYLLSNNVSTHDVLFELWHRFINHNVNQLIWIDVLVFCSIIEINWHFVFVKYRFAIIKFITATLGLGLLFSSFILLHNLVFAKFVLLPGYFAILLAYLLYAGCFIFIRNYFEANKIKAEQLQQKTMAELRALKAQLDPHFFFNTLNNIYGTALAENAQKTSAAIDKLASLMRYVMDVSAQDERPLNDEFAFIDDYVVLQKTRLPDRENIVINTNIEYGNSQIKIPSLLFLPFIENAFKYGVSIDKECFINLSLTVANGRVLLQLFNSIHLSNSANKGTGTGILNARRRLQLLYPNKHKLDVVNDGNVFSVKLEIPV